MSDWSSFWDSKHSIYVNARHKDVHYRRIAEQIAGVRAGPAARCSTTAAARRCTRTAWRRRRPS